MFIRNLVSYHSFLPFIKDYLTSHGWTIHRHEPDNTEYLSGGDHLIAESSQGGCMSIGLDYNETASVYTLVGNCFPSFNSSKTWHQQDKSAALTEREHPRITLDLEFEVMMWINERRVIIVARHDKHYHAMHLGLILPYAPPSSHPMPLYASGSYISSVTVNEEPENPIFSITNQTHGVLGYGHSLMFYPKMSWSTEVRHYPCDHMRGQLGRCDNGNYPLYPVMVYDRVSYTSLNIHFGAVDGLYRTSGEELRPRDNILIDGRAFIAIPNNHNRSMNDFYLIENDSYTLEDDYYVV